MENLLDFEDWQLSKLNQFLAVTNNRDKEAALSLLKSLNWNMEKAIEVHLLDNKGNLSTSSSGSDFVVIDQNSLSNREHNEDLIDSSAIIYDTDWKTAVTSSPDDTMQNSILSLPDDTSESDDSCEVISVNDGINAMSYANIKENMDNNEHCDSKINFILGNSSIMIDYMQQKSDDH
ncbi:UBA-like domain family protein [Brugia pahangi]